MVSLKIKYWEILFNRLDAITSRLTTKSKKTMLDKLTENATIAFTETNAYTVVLWAIKNANQYFDDQLVELFRELSTFEGVSIYKSNQKTWEQDKWRYMNHWDFQRGQYPLRYALDYRIVVSQHSAINKEPRYNQYEFPGGLSKQCHELIADVIAVFSNMGFKTYSSSSLDRAWEGGQWENFCDEDSDDILFQVKAYQNGNLHFRFKPEAIKALNIQAGRILKWVRTEDEVVTEMGISRADAKKYFNQSLHILPSNVKLLEARS
jgi:hypothetical protein